MSECSHDLAERETACADGFCPLCLRTELAEAKEQASELDNALVYRINQYRILEQELAEARKEISRLKREGFEATPREQQQSKILREQDARLTRLDGALRKYGKHGRIYDLDTTGAGRPCAIQLQQPCDCGLTTALQGEQHG